MSYLISGDDPMIFSPKIYDDPKYLSLSKNARFLLHYFFNRVNGKNIAWPSNSRMVKDTGLSLSEIKYKKEELIKSGWICKTLNGTNNATYSINLPRPQDDLPRPQDDLPRPQDDLPRPQDDLALSIIYSTDNTTVHRTGEQAAEVSSKPEKPEKLTCVETKTVDASNWNPVIGKSEVPKKSEESRMDAKWLKEFIGSLNGVGFMNLLNEHTGFYKLQRIIGDKNIKADLIRCETYLKSHPEVKNRDLINWIENELTSLSDSDLNQKFKSYQASASKGLGFPPLTRETTDAEWLAAFPNLIRVNNVGVY